MKKVKTLFVSTDHHGDIIIQIQFEDKSWIEVAADPAETTEINIEKAIYGKLVTGLKKLTPDQREKLYTGLKE